MPYDARLIANRVLDFGDELSVSITHLQLQKLVFFCHGHYLGNFSEKLVLNDVEAWEYGPVFPDIYECFKQFRRLPIKSRAMIFDYESRELVPIRGLITEKDNTFIRSIFDKYSKYDALYLSKLTHAIGSPWFHVWHCPAAQRPLSMRISPELIRDYYSAARDS